MSKVRRSTMTWGKIASLPFALLLELNGRIRNGDSLADILPWVNSLPLVRARLQVRFGGQAITSGDILKWKGRDYAVYLRHLAKVADETRETVPAAAMLSIHRKGKVARLPYQLRQKVNQRLLDRQTGRSIIAWLNGEPAVIDRINMYFGGRAITEKNLSTWRRSGYQDYLKTQGGTDA